MLVEESVNAKKSVEFFSESYNHYCQQEKNRVEKPSDNIDTIIIHQDITLIKVIAVEDLKIILHALSKIVYILKVMNDPPNTMKKVEKLQSKGLQGENAYNQDAVGMDTELSKGAESERERSTKRSGTGA